MRPAVVLALPRHRGCERNRVKATRSDEAQFDKGKRKARRNLEMRLTDTTMGSVRRTKDEQEKSGRGVCRRRRRRRCRCRRDGGGWVAGMMMQALSPSPGQPEPRRSTSDHTTKSQIKEPIGPSSPVVAVPRSCTWARGKVTSCLPFALYEALADSKLTMFHQTMSLFSW
jgi:hypothetical protein